ncbi:MAG: 5-oxopent-3-ene-1,2,5-tricarboxylate decarboxylase, partial [Alphaproteobacteria bacterium]
MRLVTFSDGSGTRIGALDTAGAVRDIAAAAPSLPRELLGLFAADPAAVDAARDALGQARVVRG